MELCPTPSFTLLPTSNPPGLLSGEFVGLMTLWLWVGYPVGASNRRIFASQLCWSMWGVVGAFGMKVVLVLVWESQETHVIIICHDMTLAVKVALNPNLIISLSPYYSQAYNSVLPVPKCTQTFEATRKRATWPMTISPCYPKPVDWGHSAIYWWLC